MRYSLYYTRDYYVIYTMRQCYSLPSHSMTLFLLGYALLETSIFIQEYIFYLLLNTFMRFNFRILRFIFFRNYMNFYNPLINCIFHIHSFHLLEIQQNIYSSQQEIQPQLPSSLTRYNRYRRLCHGLCFLDPGSLIRETFTIIEVVLSITIIFSQYSHNVRSFYLCHFSTKR